MFSQKVPNDRLREPFIVLSEVESTNNYAMAKLQSGQVNSGTCLMALVQTKGRGQRGKKWESKPDENITMSTVLNLTEQAYQLFQLSAATALACIDLLKILGVPEMAIKWPNDVYIRDRKAGGILIETVMRGAAVTHAVIGIGLNLNQASFPDLGQPVTSVGLELNTSYNPLETGRLLHSLLLQRTTALNASSVESTMAEYNTYLYKRGEEVRLRKDNVAFLTRIKHVNASGRLVTEDVMEREFSVGEVAFS